MRLGIDGRALQGHRTGIGRYVFEICRELDTLLPHAEFFVYAPAAVELPVVSNRWHCRVEPRRWARSLKPIAWLKLRAGGLCRKDRLDVFWGAATLLPPLPAAVRCLSTVYDLTFRIAPETMARTHLLAQRLFFAHDVRRADQRLAISQGTAERLQGWLGPPRAAVVRPAVSRAFRPRDSAAVARTLARFGITQPYFLAVATWEPRKNLELLIRVFRALQAEGELRNYHLVLAGGAGWKDEHLRALVGGKSSGAGAAPIIPVGFVTDDQLAELYTGCSVFVFPSRYEGFGIPLLEARACGAAVIATDLPELREAGGEDAIYVDPTAEGLRVALRRVKEYTAPAPLPSELLPSWRDSAAVLARYIHAD